MSDFAQAVEVVLEHEGGFVDNAHDPGGATKYGISLRFLRSLGHDLDYGADVDASYVRKMTRGEAVGLYEILFWDPAGFDGIRDQQCATKVFDAAVNMGPKQADALACRACGIVPADLAHPPIDLINAMPPAAWLKAMISEQSRFYRHLVAEKPGLDVFLAGWLRRAAWPWPALAAVGVA